MSLFALLIIVGSCILYYFLHKNNRKKGQHTVKPLLQLDYYKKQKANIILQYNSTIHLETEDEVRIHKRIYEILYREGDNSIIKDILLKHGIFATSFIVKFYSERIKNINDKEIRKELKSFAKYKLYMREVAYKMNDIVLTNIGKTRIDSYISHFTKTIKNKRKCAVCNRYFEVLKLPHWLYYGSNANVNTCFECPINITPTNEDIKVNINKFINACGFIPDASFSLWSNSHTERIESNKWIEVYKAVLGFGGVDYVKGKYGSWFNALVDNDIFPNGIQKTSRGFKCVSKSGNICNSLAEMYIDDCLFEMGIDYEKEPMYPKHSEFNKNGRMRADWKLGDIFIEYFGLQGNHNYDIKTQRKINLCESENLRLLAIYPKDIKDVKSKINKEMLTN